MSAPGEPAQHGVGVDVELGELPAGTPSNDRAASGSR